MYPQIEIILSLAVIGLALLMLILSAQLFRMNRKKAIVTLIISLLYTLLGGYYFYSTLFLNMPKSLMEKELIRLKTKSVPAEKVSKEQNFATSEKENDFFIVLQVGDNILEVADGDEIEINKNARFKIQKVKTIPEREGIKADFKGFAGNTRFNDQQDIGYWITYNKILKYWKVDDKKEKYEIQILKDKEKLGSIHITFIN